MTCVTAVTKEEFIGQLNLLLEKQIPSNERRQVKSFVNQYFAMQSIEDINSMEIENAVGNALSMWKFIEQSSGDSPKIAVFNPSYKENGWYTNHTVVRVLEADMPFIVDSLRLYLIDKNLSIHYLQNIVLEVNRDAQYKRIALEEKGLKSQESVVHIEIDRLESKTDLKQLEQDLSSLLADVVCVVEDFKPMQDKIQQVKDELLTSSNHPDNKEVSVFLDWLIKNFIFLGFELLDVKKPKNQVHSQLGLLKSGQPFSQNLKPGELGCQTLFSKPTLVFCKAARRANVHRRAYPDFIAVKRYDTKGKVIGEVRIMGLYTSPVYSQSPRDIPWLRLKIEAVMQRSMLDMQGYLGKELTQILEVFPRDELLQIPEEQLFQTAMSVLQIQERHQVRVFVRDCLNGVFVSALVYVPRDRFSTNLRVRMQTILEERLNAVDTSFNTYFSESILARLHFIFRIEPGQALEFDHASLTKELIIAASSWEDELANVMVEAKGEGIANQLLRIYGSGFTPAYKDMFHARTAVIDIDYCESLSEIEPLALSFYKDLNDAEASLHFKVYHYEKSLPLSEQIPIFENLGLRVMGEHPYIITKNNGQKVWIHDFSMQLPGASDDIDIHKINDIFTDSFRKIWYQDVENDSFNRLVLAASMSWQQITVLRAYARYMKQIGLAFSQDYIADTLHQNITITKLLSEFFVNRFDPNLELSFEMRIKNQEQLREDLVKALDSVHVLSQDKILRCYIALINNTLRTNFYQLNSRGMQKNYISFKLSPAGIPDIPKPAPRFEIFVYSARVEGVHLRYGKVARGGLRWSDRVEDFRTEVLGLVKAQQVKNSVIVPVGAKGGFVPKNMPESEDREVVMREGISCYKTFINALLDVTDNLQHGSVNHPEQVIRYDEDDTYLVVAADKGTATFSDIANEIAKTQDFWLGDAFASGGSVGYDHKAMGITAKGAWVSVQRHFREMGVNVQTESVSVIGIGDMGGDVFGNGMLLSEKIELVAAFNHLHIFIDPFPIDVQASFAERKRLFDMPRSNWSDYNKKLLSQGGGIFSRKAKFIPIPEAMKKRFAICEDILTPVALIKALLKAPVDLVWNGGIGTYVKANTESHEQVGDKANDNVRVNGNELGCKVFGEGGNLGLTQLGRVEYALHKNGRLNTDFIDNAAGVNCSDCEVNIKILLNTLVTSEDLTGKQRDHLLEEMTGEVSELVLANNYRQTQAISMAERKAKVSLEQYMRFMGYLESKGKLDREIEFLPNNETLKERSDKQQSLSRPEISTLVSYAKLDLKEALLNSTFIDQPYMVNELYSALPKKLKTEYSNELKTHRLRREIIATQVAKHIVDSMGVYFAQKLHKANGVKMDTVAKAFIMARDIFNIEYYWKQIEKLDCDVSTEVQYQMLEELSRLINRACRWFIRLESNNEDMKITVKNYVDAIIEFTKGLEAIMISDLKVIWREHKLRLEKENVPKNLSRFIAAARFMFYSLPIADVASNTGHSLKDVCQAFMSIGSFLQLPWLSRTLTQFAAVSHWESIARDNLRDELVSQQQALAISLLSCEGECIDKKLENWKSNKSLTIKKWQLLLDEVQSSSQHELAMFTIANSELLELSKSS